MMYIFILFSSLLMAATDPIETVRFKIVPTAYMQEDPILKEMVLDWYGEEFGQRVNDHLHLRIQLNSDKFDDIWLWQTYNVFQPKEIVWVAPKLPKKCVNFAVTYNFSPTKFNMQVMFHGLACKGLAKILKNEKIFITYKGIQLNEEDRVLDQVDFIIDDLPERIKEFR